MNAMNGMNTQQTVSGSGSIAAVRQVVIVDSSCDLYGDFVRSAQEGEIGVHFCVDGRSAVRLARRFRADIWLVAAELPDMSGFDLLEMLSLHVLQADVDPLRSGARISLDHLGSGGHPGIFVVADSYRLEDEQRALASGVAGYLVRPVSIDLVRGSRPGAACALVPPVVERNCS